MEKATDLYREILANGPSPSTLLIICRNMKEEGRVNEAAQTCLKGLDLYPGDIHIRWLLAECYLELGFFSLAEKEITTVADQVESLAPVFRTQADLLERQGRREEASAALERYLVHVPGDTEAAARLGSLKPVEESPPAQTPPPEEIVPEIATHTLAEIYENQGQLTAAVETYRKLVEQDPGDLRAKERLEKLEAELRGEDIIPVPPGRTEDGTERLIGILEGWLTIIQETGSVGP